MDLKVPAHIGIIMDGNGRWAKQRGLKRTEGHKKGALTLEKIAEYAYEKNIKVLSVFAFSTENWKRDKEEVEYLMNLSIKYFQKNFKAIKKKGVKVIFSGVKKGLSKSVIDAMNNIVKETENNTEGIFNICFNYGGKDEIVEATKKIASSVQSGSLKIDDINEEMYNKYLFNDLPPMDLLIRTSGEKRISNFMLWSLAYSEFYFTDVLWPDFDNEELDKALESFSNRDRRFGSVKNN